MNHPALFSISPIDGRYAKEVSTLAPFFSEAALMRYRILVEVQYLIALSNTAGIREVKRLTSSEQKLLVNLYTNFTEAQAAQIKTIEAETKHDVKAIEYYIKHKLQHTALRKQQEFVHFGLTSEDINNLAYSLMVRDALKAVYVPQLRELIKQLKQRARRYSSLAMLSLTHGQPATPTTLGKELMVFTLRLQRQLDRLTSIRLLGKFSGATGNWAALHVAYPKLNWRQFSKQFIQKLGLEFNPATTQIESHDRLVETYQAMATVNAVLRDLDQDCWFYISRGLFVQHNVAGEVGSSAMPHKINPIYFENSEGNIGVANALLNHLAEKLPVSRMQRDLTDSTLLRNQGVAVAHSLLAILNTLKALARIEPNKIAISDELNAHWEVLAEPIQTVMRKLGKPTPYEQLKRLTRGQQLDKTTLHIFIDSLDLPEAEKKQLKALTPANYIGLSKQIAES